MQASQTLLKKIPDTTVTNTVTRQSLQELLDISATAKERMTLVYQNKVFLAVVPIEDIGMIEKIEDYFDIQAVKEAHEINTPPIPLEEAKKILGW